MSPGSVGAAQGAAGMLTDAQLGAAYGVNSAGSGLQLNLNLNSNPSTTPTTSPLTYADPTATSGLGKYLTLGKMGYDMNQKSLKQLYDSLTGVPDVDYSYVADEAPIYVDVAAANRLPTAMTPYAAPDPLAGLDLASFGYAQGGAVQRFSEGGQSDTANLAKALKSLGEIGAIDKPSRHDLRRAEGPGYSYTPKVLPQLAAVLQARGMKLAEGGQPDDHTHPNYDGTPLLRTGGLSGLGGKYVEGKGDGTSDDIAAMLANGEYVFSADVVAALGNGSNKAGAEELDKMVQAIRSRARSAPPDKLPPDAKSPLEYLKSSKGKKHG